MPILISFLLSIFIVSQASAQAKPRASHHRDYDYRTQIGLHPADVLEDQLANQQFLQRQNGQIITATISKNRGYGRYTIRRSDGPIIAINSEDSRFLGIYKPDKRTFIKYGELPNLRQAEVVGFNPHNESGTIVIKDSHSDEIRVLDIEKDKVRMVYTGNKKKTLLRRARGGKFLVVAAVMGTLIASVANADENEQPNTDSITYSDVEVSGATD